MLSKAELPKRIQGIDLLRGFAILFVILNHVNIRLLGAHVPYTEGLPAQLVSSLVWNGQRGVQIFFAVSGFLITSTILRRWFSLPAVNVGGFYRLRFARIAPLLLLLLALLSGLDLAHVRNFVVSPKTGGLPRALLAALTFHINVLEASRGYLPANWDILWSLSVEEMFYLFYPWLCRLIRRESLFIAMLVIFAVAGPFARVHAQSNEVWYEYSYLGGMDAIALGCLTALLAEKKRLSVLTLRVLISAGLSLLIASLALSNWIRGSVVAHYGLDMTIVAVGTCLLMVAASQTKWTGPKFLRAFSWLGARSYEVYLTHMFVVFACFELFVRAGKPLGAVPALFITVILIAALLGGWIAYSFSEPMNKRLREPAAEFAAETRKTGP